MTTESQHYTATAKWLHWIIAVLIIFLLILGFYMSGLPRGPDKTALVQLHKSVGIIVLTLATVRVGWRLRHKPPALPASMSWFLKKATHSIHWTLYLLMFLQPLSGWVMSSARGFPVSIAGIIPLPSLVEKDEALAEILKERHEFLGWALVLLIIGHVVAALKHHFVDKDDVLLRMAIRPNKHDT
ncbi:cytochrome b [Methylococcus sp. EFPC2]|uniref:cytochrome b n=1 Tax=Methylococcus sp. EFPC2 TaxID=2812648 RepID=UPI001967C5E5|nr:cytochrome b [Methylococcus sp. EFPC2]QSA97577.1 cytochrome b [Methylococcus sp. EFPC2]